MEDEEGGGPPVLAVGGEDGDVAAAENRDRPDPREGAAAGRSRFLGAAASPSSPPTASNFNFSFVQNFSFSFGAQRVILISVAKPSISALGQNLKNSVLGPKL